MKKVLYAILGAALVLVSCAKESERHQNPYRLVVDYQPQTVTIKNITGTVTPVESYDWIASNGNGSFTVRRNTSGLVRKAEFTISGVSDHAMVFQKAHSLDASLASALVKQGIGMAEIDVTVASECPDDYASWGFVYSTENDVNKGKDCPQEGAPVVGVNHGTLTGLAEGTDYYVWSYVESTEGNRVYSSVLGLVPPVYVQAGEDLQAAIDGAKEFAEIRVQGGATFPGTIVIDDKNKNKTISGGWNAEFTEQSWDNLTVIDGGGKNRGFYCGVDPISDNPLDGYVNISYFEITNCLSTSGHGSAIRVSGGPITVHHCYIHDNVTDRGTIATREDNESSDIEIYNCVITNNTSTGHAAAISIEDGKDWYGFETYATIANCLIANNTSTKEDSACSAVYVYNKVIVKFFNNTVYGNIATVNPNTPAVWAREWGKNHFVNNIIVGNVTGEDGSGNWANLSISDTNDPAVYNNIINGTAGCGNAEMVDNLVMEVNADAGTVLAAPSMAHTSLQDYLGGNYLPVGKAVGYATLGVVTQHSGWDGINTDLDIKAMQEKYATDLAGNPRIVNGKLDAGCYQAQ